MASGAFQANYGSVHHLNFVNVLAELLVDSVTGLASSEN